MLSVVRLKVILLSAIMLNIIKPKFIIFKVNMLIIIVSVIMLSVVLLSVLAPLNFSIYLSPSTVPMYFIHRYRRRKIDCSSLFTVPATSAAQNSLLFFFFLLRQLTKLTFITRQAVRAVKQSIFLRCLWFQTSLRENKTFPEANYIILFPLIVSSIS
jgi:hypothetical protein